MCIRDRSSLSLLKINKGVSFSEDTEDVKLMFVLAAKDSNSQMCIRDRDKDLLLKTVSLLMM